MMTIFEEELLKLVTSNSVEKLAKLLKAYKASKKAFEESGFKNPLNINFISMFADSYTGIPKTRGKTALHVAVEKQYPEIVKLLLEADAAVDGLDHSNNTALCYAILNDDPELVQVLVDAKANVNINREVMFAFIALLKSSSDNRCGIANILIKASLDFDAMISHGVYLLHVSARNRDFAMIQLLLKAGMKVYLYDGYESALSIVSNLMTKPHQAQVYYDTNIKIINCLLDYGAGLYRISHFTSDKIHTVNKIVIGLKIATNGIFENVTRETPGFKQAITNLEELKAFMQTPAAYSAESLAHLKHVFKTAEEMLKDPNVVDKGDLAAILHQLQVVKLHVPVQPEISKVNSLLGICLNNLNGISSSKTFKRAGFFAERSKVFASKDTLPADLLVKLAPVSMELVK